MTLGSVELRGRRFFSSAVNVLQTLENEVIERVLWLNMIAQVIDVLPLNGNGASNGARGSH